LLHKRIVKMKNAALYIRKSTDTDGQMNQKQQNSLNVQRALSQQYSKGHFNLVKEFSDSETGRKTNREGLQAALTWLRANKDAVLITKSDRISRTLDIIPEIRDVLDRIRFIDLQMPNEPIDEFRFQLAIMLAERESKTLGARVAMTYAFLEAQGNADHWGRSSSEMDEIRSMGHRTSQARAGQYALKLIGALSDLEAAGYNTLKARVARLNEIGVTSARGKLLTVPGVIRTIRVAKRNETIRS
jgi:DNA invertase Pin-like site-specific DNA recombinase